jgi:YVTN family beta-propeller protein
MLKAIICIGFLATTGGATDDAPTRVQASQDQRWAAGADLDSGLTGTLVVLNKAEASVSLLDAGSGRERAKVQVGSGPHEVAISPDGTTAVVANYGQREPGNTLTVIDLAAMRARATINLGDYHRPHGIQFFPDGKRVAVTAEVERAVIVVDIANAVVETAVNTEQEISHMLVLSPDASRIYVTSIGSGTMTVVDIVAGTVIGTVATGAGAEGLDISPDGTEVWVGNRADDTLSIVDTATLAITATVPCPGFPIRVKFSIDGKHVLVSNAKAAAVAVFDAARRVEIKRIAMKSKAVDNTDDRLFGDRLGRGPVPVGILVEPSGRYAFVANTNADVVTVLDVSKWKVYGRVTAGTEPDGLGWSGSIPRPDGQEQK